MEILMTNWRLLIIWYLTTREWKCWVSEHNRNSDGLVTFEGRFIHKHTGELGFVCHSSGWLYFEELFDEHETVVLGKISSLCHGCLSLKGKLGCNPVMVVLFERSLSQLDSNRGILIHIIAILQGSQLSGRLVHVTFAWDN